MPTQDRKQAKIFFEWSNDRFGFNRRERGGCKENIGLRFYRVGLCSLRPLRSLRLNNLRQARAANEMPIGRCPMLKATRPLALHTSSPYLYNIGNTSITIKCMYKRRNKTVFFSLSCCGVCLPKSCLVCHVEVFLKNSKNFFVKTIAHVSTLHYLCIIFASSIPGN